MKTLHLNLKACWYDLIEQGIKTEEYREIKPYWGKRLTEFTPQFFKHYDAVQFTYGYTKRNMLFECKGIQCGTGRPEWGAEPGKEYFVIKLGKRIN